MLLLLDNARDSEQVRPLLPGNPGSVTIVTSRNHLTGLMTTDGTEPISLGVLPPADAHDILARRVGADRLIAEPDAVDTLVHRCAGSPLALAIIGARAAAYPALSLASIAKELHTARSTLDAFGDSDSVNEPRAVFSWSYHALSAPSARLFRLIGNTATGPHLSTLAIAILASVSAREIRPLLAALVRANLLNLLKAGRHAVHDLSVPMHVNYAPAPIARRTDALDLRDAMLVGFSTGGGEVARYVGRAAIWKARARVGVEPLRALFARVCLPVATVDTVGAFYPRVVDAGNAAAGLPRVPRLRSMASRHCDRHRTDRSSSAATPAGRPWYGSGRSR
jgi:hypothetical protein